MFPSINSFSFISAFSFAPMEEEKRGKVGVRIQGKKKFYKGKLRGGAMIVYIQLLKGRRKVGSSI